MTQNGSPSRIVVAMSGGIDSSLAAALLKERGHEVVGLTMRLTREESEPKAVTEARKVAAHLGIPHHVIALEDAFEANVIAPFIESYRKGETPNPCARCNFHIKFGHLLDEAQRLGGDFLATGHYARNLWKDGRFRLCKGADATKDQSYFLFTLTQERLARVLFPLGDLTKKEVRALAAERALPVPYDHESQEICFIPNDDYVRFLESVPGPAPEGDIVTAEGTVLGRHKGIHRYTIGQRKGLGLSHPTPLFVLALDARHNRVIVGDETALFRSALEAKEISWIGPAPEANREIACKIRYRHAPIACRLENLCEGRARVALAAPERAITPGQALVFYEGDEVLGGGWIEKPLG